MNRNLHSFLVYFVPTESLNFVFLLNICTFMPESEFVYLSSVFSFFLVLRSEFFYSFLVFFCALVFILRVLLCLNCNLYSFSVYFLCLGRSLYSLLRFFCPLVRICIPSWRTFGHELKFIFLLSVLLCLGRNWYSS